MSLKLGPRHRIPNRAMRENNQTIRIDDQLLPEPDVAMQHFHEIGGQLTAFSDFGQDPLQSNSVLVTQRETRFRERYPDFNQFFYDTVNGNYSNFRDGLLYLIDISKQLEIHI